MDNDKFGFGDEVHKPSVADEFKAKAEDVVEPSLGSQAKVQFDDVKDDLTSDKDAGEKFEDVKDDLSGPSVTDKAKAKVEDVKSTLVSGVDQAKAKVNEHVDTARVKAEDHVDTDELSELLKQIADSAGRAGKVAFKEALVVVKEVADVVHRYVDEDRLKPKKDKGSDPLDKTI